MMSEIGRVVAVDGDTVWVQTERSGTCGNCAARSGCGHGLLASLGRDSYLVRALLPGRELPRLSLDDKVRISIPERGFLRGVALMYLLPLCSMLLAATAAGVLLADAALSQGQFDLRVTLAAAAGLAIGLLLLRSYEHRHAANRRLQPVVTERL